MNRYIILHRIRSADDFPRPVVVLSSSIIAIDGLEDGSTDIYFHPQVSWRVAEDDQSVLTALGFFDDGYTEPRTNERGDLIGGKKDW